VLRSLLLYTHLYSAEAAAQHEVKMK